MSDRDELFKRGIPGFTLVSERGVATDGTASTTAMLRNRGLEPICEVNSSGVAVSGSTIETLRSRGISFYCPVSETGVTSDAVTIAALRNRGIPFYCPVSTTGVAIGGTATIAQLAARGIPYFCALDSAGALGSLGVYTSNLKLTNTSNFRTTYQAGARNVRVAFIGDSTFRGQSFGVGTAQAVNAFPMQLATLLNAVGINAGANNVWGDGGSWGAGQTIANFKLGDSRVTSTAAFALGSVLSAGGNNFAVSAAGTLSFVPQASCDTAQIIWRDGFTGRDWDWSVDGGAATNVLSTNVTQFGVVPAALGALGAHTLTISWDLGAVTILGVDAYNSARKELTLWNWGICGATSANLINNVDVVGRLNILAHASLKPDLAFIEGGLINDWRTSIALATSKANLTTLVSTVKANGGDVILCVPVFDSGSSGLTASQALYVGAMYEVAAEQNVGLIDIRKKWGSYAAGLASGYYHASDTVHPTTAGYLDMATVTRNAIQLIV